MEDKNQKWYIVQVVTGYEQKVKEDLENHEFDDEMIKEIFLPLKLHITKTNKHKFKSMFPGYLYIKVEMTDESWFTIRNTNYVTGIVGSSGQRTKPTSVSEIEISRIKEKELEERQKVENIEANSSKKIVTSVPYKEGDSVKISEGEFVNYEGKVINISIETQKTSIELEIFGRIVNLTLDLDMVKKI